MREFTFTLEYELDAQPLADVFAHHPKLQLTCLACCATSDSIWRLDRISGPAEALALLNGRFLNRNTCNQCLSSDGCDTEEYTVVNQNTNQQTVYTYQRATHHCTSVPAIAAKHLGDGLVFACQRNNRTEEWRILMPDDADVRTFHDSLTTNVADGIHFQMGHLEDAVEWRVRNTHALLPPEQRTALEVAYEKGYYETPRDNTVSELAEQLEIPQSTLSYRLQRAESKLVASFLNMTRNA